MTPSHIIVGAGLLPFFLLLVFTACRPTAGPVAPINASSLINRLEASTKRIKDFKGSADVVTYLNDRRGRVSVRIRFLAPDRYRVDVQGGFLQVIAVLLIEDSKVLLYAPRENTVFEGFLNDGEVMTPGLQIPLSDIRAAAVGLSNLSPYIEKNISEYNYEDGRAVLTVRAENLVRTLQVDTEKLVVLEEEELHSSGHTVTRSFDQYRKRSGIWRPGRIQIDSTTESESMELIYNTQSVNSGLTQADLTVRFPESVIRRPLEEAVLTVE